MLGTILEDFKQFISHIVKYEQPCVARNDLLERHDGMVASTELQRSTNIVELLGFLGVI